MASAQVIVRHASWHCWFKCSQQDCRGSFRCQQSCGSRKKGQGPPDDFDDQVVQVRFSILSIIARQMYS